MMGGRLRTIGCLQARSFYFFVARVLALHARCCASRSPNAQVPVVQATANNTSTGTCLENFNMKHVSLKHARINVIVQIHCPFQTHSKHLIL